MYGIYQAAKINDYNKKYITSFYRNRNLHDIENIEFLLSFFENNKITFTIMGMIPTTETLIKIVLIVVNIGLSLLSGIISKKII